MPYDENQDELKKLSDCYEKRQDLKSTFPEVEFGNFQALINWASAVCNKRWSDIDYDSLKEYTEWYTKNEKVVNNSIAEKLAQEIIAITNSSPYTTIHSRKKTDISDHVMTLHIITLENDLKRVLELGVRDGESTVALAEAVSKIGGHLWSMDISSCNTAKKQISEYGLSEYWTFIQGDDKQLASSWNQEVDHIFVDTSHIYEDMLNELILYEKFVRLGGYITFHDTVSYPDVLRAVKDFLTRTKSKFRFYNYNNCNGFGILRKIS